MSPEVGGCQEEFNGWFLPMMQVAFNPWNGNGCRMGSASYQVLMKFACLPPHSFKVSKTILSLFSRPMACPFGRSASLSLTVARESFLIRKMTSMVGSGRLAVFSLPGQEGSGGSGRL